MLSTPFSSAEACFASAAASSMSAVKLSTCVINHSLRP